MRTIGILWEDWGSYEDYRDSMMTIWRTIGTLWDDYWVLLWDSSLYKDRDYWVLELGLLNLARYNCFCLESLGQDYWVLLWDSSHYKDRDYWVPELGLLNLPRLYSPLPNNNTSSRNGSQEQKRQSAARALARQRTVAQRQDYNAPPRQIKS